MSTLNVAYAPQIQSAAQRYGLDPTLLAAVAAQETGGPGANSGRNIVGDGGHGHGIFQIDDRYHTFASTPAAMDPQANADYAAWMISSLIKQNGGNVHAALSAYNAGSAIATGTKTTWGDGRTLGYADSVMRHYAQLSGGTTPPAAIATDGSTTSSASTLADAQANSRSAQLQTTMLQQMYSNFMSGTTNAIASGNNVASTDPEPQKHAQSSASIVSGGADGDS